MRREHDFGVLLSSVKKLVWFFFFFLKTQTCSTGCDWGITNHVSTHQLLTGTCDLTVETKS